MNASAWSQGVRAAFDNDDGPSLASFFTPLEALTAQAGLRADLHSGVRARSPRRVCG
jgi:hypothetical protein